MTDEKDDLVKEMRQYKKKEADSQARIKKLEAEVKALQVRGERRDYDMINMQSGERVRRAEIEERKEEITR